MTYMPCKLYLTTLALRVSHRSPNKTWLPLCLANEQVTTNACFMLGATSCSPPRDKLDISLYLNAVTGRSLRTSPYCCHSCPPTRAVCRQPSGVPCTLTLQAPASPPPSLCTLPHRVACARTALPRSPCPLASPSQCCSAAEPGRPAAPQRSARAGL